MGLGKLKLCTKFEVASFSRCVNIEGELSNFVELPYPGTMPTVSSACDFMMGLDKPQLLAKFKLDSRSRCRNIIGEPQNQEYIIWAVCYKSVE